MLRMERAALRASGRAPATERAYESDWLDFMAWCRSAGRVALPATADTVGLYVCGLSRAGKLPATIARRLAAISERHARLGHASPVTPDVREILAGIRRRVGAAPRHAKAALTVEELRRLLAAIDGRTVRRGVYEWEAPGGAARAARDRAILLVGFASGLRRSELAALELRDVEVAAAGLVIRIPRSKTDQEGAGQEISVHRGRRRETCPVRAYEAWLVERGRAAGALFCRVSAAGAVEPSKHMRGDAIALVVKSACERAGLDPDRYGGHSLRAGMCTAAAEHGARELAIMARSRHSSVEMVRRYVRHGTVFAVDPLAGVL